MEYRERLTIRIRRRLLPRRLSRRRRAVAGVLALSFLLSLGYSFFVYPQLLYVLISVPVIRPARAAGGGPASGVAPERLDSAVALVVSEVRRGAFPGGALAVGEGDRALLEAGIGRTEWSRFSPLVDADATLYDLASLTKVVATTAAAMVLVEDGRVGLDDPVVRWLPEFGADGGGTGHDRVTVRHLLTHTSGLAAGMLDLPGSTPEARLRYLVRNARLIAPAGRDVLYSDVGFAILALVLERAAREPLPDLLRRRVWLPLGMDSTRFAPGKGCASCAPTLADEAGDPLPGVVNDPFARRLGGISGNAGLFSTLHDVSRFAEMLARGGELDGVRVLKRATLEAFTHAQPGAGTRGLGFEVFCKEGTVPDAQGCREPYAFGHTGYTGTSLWVDPRTGRWVVLLTNRTYLPQASNHLRLVRRHLFNVVTGQSSPDQPADTAAEVR